MSNLRGFLQWAPLLATTIVLAQMMNSVAVSYFERPRIVPTTPVVNTDIPQFDDRFLDAKPRQSPRSAPYGSQSRPIAPATIDRALARHLDWPPDNCIRRERTWPRTPSSHIPLTTPSTLLDGVGIFYEVFGPRSAGRSLVFLPTWSIVHSRILEGAGAVLCPTRLPGFGLRWSRQRPLWAAGYRLSNR